MTTGAQLRDQGVAQVMLAEVSWATDVDNAFDYWLKHEAAPVFTFEQFRVWAEAHGITQPHHPNAWSALAKRYAGRITVVGYTKSERPEAHSRLTRTYRKTHHNDL